MAACQWCGHAPHKRKCPVVVGGTISSDGPAVLKCLCPNKPDMPKLPKR